VRSAKYTCVLEASLANPCVPSLPLTLYSTFLFSM
jgi:hypothetical protein